MPQIRFSPVVSHPLFSPFLHGIFLPGLLFVLPGCFPGSSRLPGFALFWRAASWFVRSDGMLFRVFLTSRVARSDGMLSNVSPGFSMDRRDAFPGLPDFPGCSFCRDAFRRLSRLSLILLGCFPVFPIRYNSKTASTITSTRNSTAFKIIGIAASNVAGALLVR